MSKRIVRLPGRKCVSCGAIGCVAIGALHGLRGPMCGDCFLELKANPPSPAAIKAEAEKIKLERLERTLDVNGGVLILDE
jgi:hypothetical protein